jgi:hypothetical protein
MIQDTYSFVYRHLIAGHGNCTKNADIGRQVNSKTIL